MPKVTFGARTFLGDLGFYTPQINSTEGRVAQQKGEAIEAQAAAIR